MNRRNFSRGFILFLAAVLLICSTFWSLPSVSAQDDGSKSKVSSLLDMRVKLKVRHLQSGAKAKGVTDPGNDVIGLESDASAEKVYIHFVQQPTAVQLSELEKLGITVYPDSWLPPVGDFSTGFMLASMPVDKLDKVAEKNYVVRLDTAEQTAEPQNDLGRAAMNVGDVWTAGYNGAGVIIAVLDSGIDTSNSDFPTLNTSNSKDYSNYPILDDTIANTVTGHGTHVAGSSLGRGTLNASYKGSAPGASLVFLKIGNDTTGSASTNAIVYAIRAAVDTYSAKIITMSYGGWSTYHDGTDEMCQAVDYAVSHGATVFISAGNDGAKDWHYSGTVGANSTTGFIQMTANVSTLLACNLVWYDGLGTSNTLRLKYYNSAQTEITAVTTGSQSESPRGTESVLSQFTSSQPNSTYYLKVQNTSATIQVFHIYYRGGSYSVTFNSPDPNYTLGSPAEAESAIAVGAYVTRTSWTDYLGAGHTSSETLNNIATFSSRGPRVDGGAPGKPEIVAPGSVIISARDPLYALGNPTYNPYIIDNDGVNNGLGPANYYVMQGTSMACPLAAGVGALLLSKSPTLTPAQVKNILETTATDKGVPGYDNTYGYGLINASAAINALPSVSTTAATSIASTSATLNGNLTSLAGC